MIYVLDTNSISTILRYYYPDSFVSFWQRLEVAVQDGNLVSVHESKVELSERFSDGEIDRLVIQNPDFFAYPSVEELGFITRIYSVPHFRQNLERKKLLKGGSFADPFIVAKAVSVNGTVVTEEVFKENAVKIPNICRHFGIGCVCFREFLVKENWVV